jgi:uncharacterized phage infection (PIP) family protein YhgE
VADEMLVSALDPEEGPVPDKAPKLCEMSNHYTTLHTRLNKALQDFRVSGENIGLILIENIKFNRDKLAEYIDRFEELIESMPPMEEMQKFLDGVESVRTELVKHTTEIDDKVKTGITTALATGLTPLKLELAAIRELADSLASRQRQVVQRDPHLDGLLKDTVNRAEVLRTQVIDLNNRLSGLYERQQMADDLNKREVAGAIAARAAMESRLEALENKVNGST